jgi:methylthioribose-1-phosphate isomerase
MAIPKSIEWVGNRYPPPDSNGFLRLIDQTQLPSILTYRDCRTVEDVWEAIKNLRVRGAPAIGITAAYGVVIGMQGFKEKTRGAYASRLREVAGYLRTSRPTAVNLFWALDRMEHRMQGMTWQVAGSTSGYEPPAVFITRVLLDEAVAIHEDDAAMCHAIGRAGADLIRDGSGVLTHCNTGGLATAEYGTALSVMLTAADQGRRFHVFADETRPLLQGARLTTWELQQAGIDVTLICDSMAAQVMKEGRVQLVIVGADRIAANGDAANKIGTYGVALLAKAHGIPFYVAAPSSTFDLNLPTGDGIPIEQRDPREVTHGFGRQTAPDGVAVYNPAFDVTPARLIAGLITEKGIIQPVTETAIRERLGAELTHP